MISNKPVKLTIVVAIYNIAAELPDLLKQIEKLKNSTALEFFLIDDESTDGSEQIISGFIKYHSPTNVSVIRRKNGGLSAVRNQGITLSKGEYIWFIDGDDVIDPIFVAQLIDILEDEQPDFIQFYYSRFKNFKEINFMESQRKIQNYEYLNSNQWFSKLTNSNEKQFENYAWAHVVRRSLYTENNIIFPVGRSYEDVATTYKLANVSDNILSIKEVGYFYRNRPGSITNNYTEKNCRGLLESISEFSKQKSLSFSKKDQYTFIHRYLVGAYYIANNISKGENKVLKNQIRKQLLANRFFSLQTSNKIEYLLFQFRMYDLYRSVKNMIKKGTHNE